MDHELRAFEYCTNSELCSSLWNVCSLLKKDLDSAYLTDYKSEQGFSEGEVGQLHTTGFRKINSPLSSCQYGTYEFHIAVITFYGNNYCFLL